METTSIDILNELLGEEQRSIAPRLLESTVFVSNSAMEELFLVRRLAAASQDHRRWLTDLIVSCGGEPGLRQLDLASADLHFQGLQFALPRLEAHLGELVRKYAFAVRRLGNDRRAAPTLSNILTRHQDALEALRVLHAGKTRAAG